MNTAKLSRFQNYLVLAILLGAVLLVSLYAAQPAYAVQGDPQTQACEAVGGCSDGAEEVSNVIATAINILSAIGGIVAVIIIIINGIRFITSNGDPQATNSARNGIIYALVGILVVVLAQVIVQFVLQRTGT